MTEQIPDTCRIDGKTWLIDAWEGSHWVIPTTEQLWEITGHKFELQSTSTTNWSGRIDHYVVENGTLYLFKVEVNLAETNQSELDEIVFAVENTQSKLEPDARLPSGHRIEEIRHYQPMHGNGELGYWVTKINRILFEDLMIPFSGKLHLLSQYVDDWEMPLSIEFNEPSEKNLTITLDRGRML